MHDHRYAIPQQPDTRPVADRIPTLLDSKTAITKAGTRIMKAPAHIRLASLGITSLPSFAPTPCWAATAALPWDQTLLALQDMLISIVAPAAIALALSGAVILYALGGHDKHAGRLVGSGIGGCIALGLVHLLNYVLP
jgi:hypothetical protein